MRRINMLSKADMVKGQGVLSAHDEQVALAREVMKGKAEILENARIPCHITHYHSINPEYYLSIGKKKRQGTTVGYVHFLPETVENSISLPRAAKEIFYKYMISFYKRMDYLVTVNPVFIDKLEAYGIPREKVTYIPNVVSEKIFYPLSREERLAARKKCGIREDAFTILCVGQLQKRKGVFDFVAAAKKMPDCQFVWAGGFSFGKISQGYEEIKAMLKHLPANVKFLGLVDREKMNEIYNMADVMFLPSFEELFPMTILEAMNCGLPILVRNLSIYEPILFDYALRGENLDDFVRILRQLKEETDFYQRSAHAAYLGHKFYSREHVGEMWKEFYQGLLKDPGQCRETAKKQPAVKQGQTEEKGVVLWKNRRRQFT